MDLGRTVGARAITLCLLAGAFAANPSHAAAPASAAKRGPSRFDVRARLRGLLPKPAVRPTLSIAEQQSLPVIYTSPKATTAAHVPPPTREEAAALSRTIIPKLKGLETLDRQGKVVSYRISADPKRFTREEIRSMFYPYVPNNFLARLDARWGTKASALSVGYALIQGIAHPLATAVGLAAGALTAMPLSYAVSSYFGHLRYDKYVSGAEGVYSNGQREGESHHLVPTYQVLLTRQEDARKSYLSSYGVFSLPATVGAIEALIPFGPTKAFARSFMVSLGVGTRALVRLSAMGHRAAHQFRTEVSGEESLPPHAYRDRLTEWAQRHRLLVGRHVELHHKGGEWQQSFRLSEPFPFPGGQHVERVITSVLNATWRAAMALAPERSSYVQLGGTRFSQWLSNAWSLAHLRKTGQLAFDWVEFPASIPDSVMKEILADKELTKTALAPAFWTVMTRKDRPRSVPPMLADAIREDASIVPEAFRGQIMAALAATPAAAE